MKKLIRKLYAIYPKNKPQWIKSLFHLVILTSLFWPLNIQAHPHSWVDLKTEIIGDQKQITGFKMYWTFDAMTSIYMLDGEDLSAANKSKTFQKLADSVMKNMYAEHYFTYFYDGETPIKYSMPHHSMLTKNKTKLTLNFDLPLSKPKEINGKTLKLLIFEPSYYVDMSWLKKSDIQLSSELAKHCSLKLIAPNPSGKQVSYAMSLSTDADPDNALGQLFSQSVMISCSAEKG